MARTEKFGVLIEGKETVSQAARKAEEGIKGLDKNMMLAVAAGGLFSSALQAVGRAVIGFAKDSVDASLAMEGIEKGFRRLASGSNQLLTDIRTATKSTVADIDIMRAANQALLLEIDQNSLPDMFKAAAAISQATGQDITYALEKITTAIGRQSALRLDDFGITIDATEANKKYAESIGKVAKDLTKAEKATAFMTEASAGLKDRLGVLGGEIQDTALTSINQLDASLTTLKDNIGDLVVPAIKGLIDHALLPLINHINTLWILSDPEKFIEKHREMKSFKSAITEIGSSADDASKKFDSFTESIQRKIDLIEAGSLAEYEYQERLKTVAEMTKTGNINFADSIELLEKLNKIKEESIKKTHDLATATEELTRAEQRHKDIGGIWTSAVTGEVSYGNQYEKEGRIYREWTEKESKLFDQS